MKVYSKKKVDNLIYISISNLQKECIAAVKRELEQIVYNRDITELKKLEQRIIDLELNVHNPKIKYQKI